MEIRVPRSIRRIADSEDRKLAWQFFVFFSRFEYALKRTPRYLRGTTSGAQPNWDRFGADYDEAFHSSATGERFGQQWPTSTLHHLASK